MKADWRVLPLALGLFATNAGLRAQSAANPAAPEGIADSPVDVRAEIKRLAIAAAKKIAEQNNAGAAAVVPNSAGVITMDPFIVRDRKLPTVVIPKYEAPFMHYLRTGTVFYSRGKVITTRLSTDFSGGAGGFAKPELKLNLSW